jgi:hypothetical protein
MADNEVERVAQLLAEAVGSRVFQPLHDTPEDQQVRNEFRFLAQSAFELAPSGE